MRFVDLILQNKLVEAKQLFFAQLSERICKRLEEKRREISADIYGDDADILDEGNIVRQGRIQKIRRRIRRDAKGRIIVQRNVRRSAVKGYRVSGTTVKRIPVTQRLQKARKLKRYWKTKGKARLNRTLLRRKMSMRRRKSMGIR
jgi:hypothetical protein